MFPMVSLKCLAQWALDGICGLNLLIKPLLALFLTNNLLSSHIRLQQLRDLHASVRLKIIFQKCNQHTRRRYHGIVYNLRPFLRMRAVSPTVKNPASQKTSTKSASPSRATAGNISLQTRSTYSACRPA